MRAKNVEALPLSPKEIERQAESAIKEELKKIWQTRLDKAEHARQLPIEPPPQRSTFKAPKIEQTIFERLGEIPPKLIRRSVTLVFNLWQIYRPRRHLFEKLIDAKSQYENECDRQSACLALLKRKKASSNLATRTYLEQQLEISKVIALRVLLKKDAVVIESRQTVAIEHERLIADSKNSGIDEKIKRIKKAMCETERERLKPFPSVRLNPKIFEKQEKQILVTETLAAKSQADFEALPSVDVSELSLEEMHKILPRIQQGLNELAALRDQVTGLPGIYQEIAEQYQAWHRREALASISPNKELVNQIRQRRESYETRLKYMLEAEPQKAQSSLLIEEKLTALSRVEAAIMVRLGKWPAEEITNSEPTR